MNSQISAGLQSLVNKKYLLPFKQHVNCSNNNLSPSCYLYFKGKAYVTSNEISEKIYKIYAYIIEQKAVLNIGLYKTQVDNKIKACDFDENQKQQFLRNEIAALQNLICTFIDRYGTTDMNYLSLYWLNSFGFHHEEFLCWLHEEFDEQQLKLVDLPFVAFSLPNYLFNDTAKEIFNLFYTTIKLKHLKEVLINSEKNKISTRINSTLSTDLNFPALALKHIFLGTDALSNLDQILKNRKSKTDEQQFRQSFYKLRDYNERYVKLLKGKGRAYTTFISYYEQLLPILKHENEYAYCEALADIKKAKDPLYFKEISDLEKHQYLHISHLVDKVYKKRNWLQ